MTHVAPVTFIPSVSVGWTKVNEYIHKICILLSYTWRIILRGIELVKKVMIWPVGDGRNQPARKQCFFSHNKLVIQISWSQNKSYRTEPEHLV